MSQSKWTWESDYPVINEKDILKNLEHIKNLPNLKDSQGVSFIDFAKKNNLKEVLKWLVKKGKITADDAINPQEATIKNLEKILTIHGTKSEKHPKIGEDPFLLEYDEKNRQLKISFSAEKSGLSYSFSITKEEEPALKKITIGINRYNNNNEIQDLIYLLNNKRIHYKNQIKYKDQNNNVDENNKIKNKPIKTDYSGKSFRNLSYKLDTEAMNANTEWADSIKENSNNEINAIFSVLKKLENELLKNPFFSKRTLAKYNALGNALQNYINSSDPNKKISEDEEIKDALQIRRFGWHGTTEKNKFLQEFFKGDQII